MDQSAKFWDKIAERYSKCPIADEAAYQKNCASILRCLMRAFAAKW